MGLAVVTLKKGEGRFLKSGGMWVFDNEIASVMGSFVNGDIVLVHDFDGYPLGRGFINRNSKITVRLLTRNENQKVDEDFFEKRVRDAWEYRKKVTDTSSCRVIFGEADFFPGLVVDKFEDILVVQSLALGIDRWKELILDLIKKVLAEDGITIRGVYERSDAKVRKQEGMELYISKSLNLISGLFITTYPNTVSPPPCHADLFYQLLLINFVWHFGHSISILPFPLGIRIF